MKLVVGLGNPGRKYEGTRHNVGYQVLRVLAQRHEIGRRRVRFSGELVDIRLGREPALLVAPQTYMNASGRCVGQVVEYFEVPLEALLVICDDLNLPLGKVRIRTRGSSGGQKGLEDIIAHLGTNAFPRLRIGIGEPRSRDGAAYVLDRFRPEELPVIGEAIEHAADAVEVWASEGIAVCMNRFN